MYSIGEKGGLSLIGARGNISSILPFQETIKPCENGE